MNRHILLALAAGGAHFHSWNSDKSGKCLFCDATHEHKQGDWYNNAERKYDGHCHVCGFECKHETRKVYEHNQIFCQCNTCLTLLAHNASQKFSQKEKCIRCDKCNQDITLHNFDTSTGKCQVCGYTCNHEKLYKSANNENHVCSFCKHAGKHSVVKDATAEACEHCSVCDWKYQHFFGDKEVCAHCGYTCTHPETWYSGFCHICGHQKCEHGQTETRDGGDVYCKEEHNECKQLLFDAHSDVFYVKKGIYAGRYDKPTSPPETRGMRVYQQKRNTENGSRYLDYYLVVLNITTPTNYGGSYKYTAQGLAFTKNPPEQGINDTLLSGNGKYIKSLKQYEMDGTTMHTQYDGQYTSQDFPEMFDGQGTLDKDSFITKEQEKK